jgi:uncharacterized repeat protein (TIGR03803 family)
MEKRFMQTCRRSSSNLWRVALAVLIGIAGLASNTQAQTSYQVVARFDWYNGENPHSGLIKGNDGYFYGTTQRGGAKDYGTVFKMDAAGTITVLHSFRIWVDGSGPSAGLIQGSDGSFYGTTAGGSASGVFTGYGTIFKLDAAGKLTTLHSFIDGEGKWPSTRLIQGNDGSFYGTTTYGGTNRETTNGYGTIFKIDAAGTLTTLYNFDRFNYTVSGLIQGNDGNFYGTTELGGSFACTTPWGVLGCGTVFKIDAVGTLTTLHSFAEYLPDDTSAHGIHDGTYGDLIQGSDGSFYGTTSTTVFKMDAAGTVTVLHRLIDSDGVYRPRGVVQGSDGSLYGTAKGGAEGYGAIFKIDAAGALTILHSFDSNDSYWAGVGGLVQASAGTFYGTAMLGAASGCWCGTVFRLADPASTSTTLTVSPSPSAFGQSVTLTATLTTSSGTPTGSVAFFDGLISLGTATLNVGTATLNTTTLTGGSHALRAEYAGVTDFAPSASAVVTHTVALPATFIYPANHATNVDLTQPFTWTNVSGVQAYYLYVGTNVGAKDLVNTGEIQQTSYRVPLTLPAGTTFYARLWTKVGGTWRYVDASFSTPPIARFTYPVAGTTTVDPTLPLAWTSVPDVQAYYLYVGSTLGAKDFVNTGEMQETSYRLRSTVPVNQTLYARLWTKSGGVWRFTDRTFSVMPLIAIFTSPATAGTTIDRTQPLAWTTVATAQAYYLYVGSTLGARDLVSTGEIQQTSYLLGSTLPAGQTLYGRLWTKVGGIWRYMDVTFTLR